MKGDDFDLDILDRYLAGDCSADELAQLNEWLGRNAARGEYLEAIRSAFDAGSGASFDTDAGWSRFRDRVTSPDPPAILVLEHKDTLPVAWLLKAAAIAAVVAGGYAVFRNAAPEPATSTLAIATLIGQQDTTVLADGSRVILAPDSRIAVTLAPDARTVELTGQAYFTVTPDTSRPFAVHAAGSVTEVVGTEFSVRSRAGEPVIVAVRSGLVTFGRSGADGTTLLLEPAQVGQLAGDANPQRVAGQPASVWLAWLDGVLEFDDAPLDRAAADLSRWLGVDVSIAAGLAGRRVSGRFTAASAEQVLDALCLALGLRWQRDGSSFIITEATAP